MIFLSRSSYCGSAVREVLQRRDTERSWRRSCMFFMIKAGSEVESSVPAPASEGLVHLDSWILWTWPTFRLASSRGAGLLRLLLSSHCSPDLLHHEPAGWGTTRHCEQNLWVQNQQHFSWYFSSVFCLDALQRPIKCAKASVTVVDLVSSNDAVNSLHVSFTATSAGNECLISDEINTLCYFN